MTICEIIDLLSQFGPDAKVIFTPDEYAPGGYPEWTSCVIHEQDTEADERRVVEIRLRDLGEC